MAPLRCSSEEVEQEEFGNAPGVMTCMICRRSYEESPEMVITIMTHTYCKICIREKLQSSEQAHDQFIRGVPTGQRRNNEENIRVLETPSAVTSSLPRGYVYPNSKRMKVEVEGPATANKKVPYSSLRMNPENSGIRKRKRGTMR